MTPKVQAALRMSGVDRRELVEQAGGDPDDSTFPIASNVNRA